MSFKFILSVSFTIISYGFSARLVVPDHLNNWNILQESDVWVGWTMKDDIQWCQAEKILPFDIKKIASIIEDKGNYPNVFKRIERTKVDELGNVHIVLDMPFPFSGRDYIVKYTQFKEENDVVYRFTSVQNSGGTRS